MKLLKSVKEITPIFDTIYIHPDHLKWFKDQFQVKNSYFPFDLLSGIEIRTNVYLPKWHKKWEFPADRFVEYDKDDEVWARPIRFGREVDTNEPVMYAINHMYLNDMIFGSFRLPSSLLWSSF